MSSCPQISFVMPAYKAQFLKAAIESIVSQSFQDWELIVVDDCSPYGLDKIVSQFKDDRIIYHKNSHNIGGSDLVAQWNHSIGFAKGEWVVLAADDDLYAPEFCSAVLELAHSYPTVNLIRSRVLLTDQENRPGWEDGQFPQFTDRQQFFDNWVNNKSFVCIGNYAFRRTKLIEEGGFVNFPCAFNSDIATPFVMSANGVANTAELLFSFRLSDIHLSVDRTRLEDKLKAISQFYKWLEAAGMTQDNVKLFHKKCIFDYFNQVIRFIPPRKVLHFLSLCSNASAFDKFVMLLRRIKTGFTASLC